MNKKHSGLRSRKLARLGKYALLGLVCSLSSSKSFSQLGMLAEFYNSSGVAHDVKNYTTVVAPVVNSSTTFNDVVMAGTIYVPDPTFPGGPVPKVHFMRNDLMNPGLATNVIYNSSFPSSTTQERLVDMKARDESGTNYYYLTSHTNPYLILCSNTFCSHDDIRVRKVDDNGAIIDEINIGDYYGPNVWDHNNLIPVSSLLDPANDVLYICGYYSPTTVLPNFTTSKKAFVLAVNIGGPTMYVSTGRTYDFPTSNVLGSNYDFDIAMRMKLLSDGNIAVTGSCNAQTGLPTGSTVNSGTLFLTIEPVNGLTPLAIINNGSFTKTSGPDGGSIHEYGIDIYEDDNDAGLGWIAGNKFTFNAQSPVIDPQPSSLNVTRCSTTASAVFTSRAYHNNLGWGLQIIPHNTMTSSVSQFAIVGLTNKNTCGLSTDVPSNSNIAPFILPVNCSTSTSLITTNGNYHLYPVSTGTDGTSLGISNFMTLGWNSPHSAWNPILSDRHTTFSYQFLTAPRVGNSSLGLKTFFVYDQNVAGFEYQEPNYPNVQCGYYTCSLSPGFSTENITSNTILIDQLEYNPGAQFASSNVETIYHSSDPRYCDGAYKPSNVKNMAATNKTQIYPNPATTEVSIVLPKNQNEASEVNILLVNMQGQVVSTLFHGKAEALKAKSGLQLPDVATGLYIIQVHTDGHLLHQQKLSIQK